jgi:hypothetical protein
MPEFGRFAEDEAEERDALMRWGYNPDLPPRGVSGGPGEFDGYVHDPSGALIPGKLRNWICVLDGIQIDGHSDPDRSGMCIFCSVELE